MRLLIVFIAVPLIEIGLFIQVGGIIGLWPTLLIVLITAIVGTWLVRSQGTQTLINLQGSFHNTKDPTEPLAHGAMILFAGAFLLTPGFFTDSVGFLLLFPPFRMFVMQSIRSKLKTSNIDFTTPHESSEEDVIEGQFEPVPPNEDPSGWTKD